MNTHPKWAIKYVGKSKVNAVKIVNWDDHAEIATIPHVYQFNGEKSEGSKAADLIAAAPELLEALSVSAELIRLVIAAGFDVQLESRYTPKGDTQAVLDTADAAIAKAKG